MLCSLIKIIILGGGNEARITKRKWYYLLYILCNLSYSDHMEVIRSCLTSSFLFCAAGTSIYISWTGLLILINYNFCGPTYWFLILIFIPWYLIFIFVLILHLLDRFTKEKLQVLVFIKVLLLTLVVSMMGKSFFMFWGNLVWLT